MRAYAARENSFGSSSSVLGGIDLFPCLARYCYDIDMTGAMPV